MLGPGLAQSSSLPPLSTSRGAKRASGPSEPRSAIAVEAPGLDPNGRAARSTIQRTPGGPVADRLDASARAAGRGSTLQRTHSSARLAIARPGIAGIDHGPDIATI